MFTENEKEEAKKVLLSSSPLYALGNYLNPRYLPIVDDQTVSQSNYRIPENLPKTIVLFWHEKHLPEEIMQSIQKIREHNVEYRLVLFDAEQAYYYIQKHYGQNMADLYKNRCIHPVMQSDLFRICYLLQEGGIYVDVDIHCFNALDTLFAYQDFDCFLLYVLGLPSCIENGFIAAVPHSPFLSLWLEKLQENLMMVKNFDNIWLCTGPGVLSMTVIKSLMNKILTDNSPVSCLENIKLASNSFTGRAYSHAELSYKRTSANWRKFRLSPQLYRL